MNWRALSPLVVLQLTSCVGIGIITGKQEEHQVFSVNETRSKPLRRVTPGSDGANPTRDDLRSAWGAPDRTTGSDGAEVWKYDSGLAVRGAIPMIGLGIPLIVPVGRNSQEFHFDRAGGRASRAVVRGDQMTGGYFGVSSFSDSKGVGFHSMGGGRSD